MESVSSGRSVALRGHPSGKLVGRTSGDYPGSQVQEGAVAGYLSHKHRNPPTSTFVFQTENSVGVASSTVSSSDFSYFWLGPRSVAILSVRQLLPIPWV